MIARSSLSPAGPCAAVMPSSPKCARKALITWVRCRISRSRVRWHQSQLMLLGRLDLHKTHGRTSYRLADRLGVSSVGFVALDVCLNVFRRHQTNLVAKL